MNEATVFEPSKKDMKSEYPELENISEFMELTPRELKFTWYYANKTCKYADEIDRVRVEKALRDSELADKLSEKERYDYMTLQFPDKILLAIDRMRKFNPKVRSRAKSMTLTMMNNLEKMIEITPQEMKIMSLDEKKSYSTLVKNVNDVLPELVIKVEDGFGIRERKAAGQGGGASLMDKAKSAGN